ACGDDGFKTLDVSDISNMHVTDSYDAGGSSHAIDLGGWFACVAEGESGLSIVNVSDAHSISQLSLTDTGNATDVAIENNIVYVADWDNGVSCVNISDTIHPDILGTSSVVYNSINIDVQNEIVYVAALSDGLRIIDVSDPTNPTELGHYSASGSVKDVQIMGCVAYLNVEGYGLEWIDISDSTSPKQIGYYTTTGDQNANCISGGLALIADGSNGIGILKVRQWGDDDFDDDDLTYLEEEWNWGTNTFSNDTDSDGIIDGIEARYYNYMLGEEFIMQPLVSDSSEDPDYDTLTNLQEIRDYKTSPYMMDTDGDLATDEMEVLYDNTDPLDPTSYVEQTDWGLIIIGIVVLVVITLTVLSAMGVFVKRAPLNIFLSHAVIDFEKRRIKEMSEVLGDNESVNRGFYCEQDMKGNIDDWMDEMVPLSHIFVFIASKKSVHNSVDCAREIRLGNENGLFMIPIRTGEVTWDDIKSIGLPGKDMGFEYPENTSSKPKELYKMLGEKISTIQNGMEQMKKLLDDMDIVDLSTLDKVIEMNKGDASRLARIIIKNGDIKGAITSDGNQYLSEAEIKRQAKLFVKQSEQKDIGTLMEFLSLNPFYEPEVYEFVKDILEGKKLKS
ncbi:MAG: hypothetical protein GF364_16620, partial [Candidatus Lokiarchaeota archaeon]|nr:hypothetical protein [Candidatus Lokiarchaeota archaeon]